MDAITARFPVILDSCQIRVKSLSTKGSTGKFVIKNSICSRTGTDPFVALMDSRTDESALLVGNLYDDIPYANIVVNWTSSSRNYRILDAPLDVVGYAPSLPTFGQMKLASVGGVTKPTWWNGTQWIDATGTAV